MKKHLPFLLLLASTSWIVPALNAAGNVRVAVITGGHSFERGPFFAMFEDMDNIEYTEVQHPGANDLYGSQKLKDFDVLIFYDMVQDIAEEQKRDFVHCLEEGVGMVFLHHSLVSYQDWDLFHHIIGGKYVDPKGLAPSDSARASGFKHDETVHVRIAGAGHPVTAGMQDFTIRDEVYINYHVGDHVVPVLETDHPLSPPIIGWANTYGKSRIVYLQPGHDHHAFENTNYSRLVRQAIEWVGQR